MAMVFCSGCGKQIHDSAPTCPNCGAVQNSAALQVAAPVAASLTNKRILPAFLLCFFFGWVGAHRFYVGKIGSGVAQLLTLGGLGVWFVIDLILLLCGAFTDANGVQMKQWT